jgi:DNA repair exonuclease SbcCD ATPase subunit
MEDLKSLFGESSLSYEEFSQKLSEAKDTIKLANLKTGNYVDRAKFEKAEQSAQDLRVKFDELTNSTKDYESIKTERDTIKSQYEELQGKLDRNEKFNLISSQNVNPKFAKFVYSEVQAMVNDKKDFQTALSEYLKENKEFLNGAKGTYVDLEKGVSTPLSTNEQINKFIRSKIK